MSRHIVSSTLTTREALALLNQIERKQLQTIFVVDQDQKLLGSLTDGDIRRGLLEGKELSFPVVDFSNQNYRALQLNSIDMSEVEELNSKGIELVPVLEDGKLVDLIITSEYRASLPVDALIMAGGKGKRLMPLTKDTPKPLLKIGERPIMDYNIDRLMNCGIDNIHISINYLHEKIVNHFTERSLTDVQINFIKEEGPLGTAGAIGLIEELKNDTLLLMNSDLLTTINFHDFYSFFVKEEADIAIAAIPYNVSVPYAVLETEGHRITKLKEKPVYTYYSNAGIYLMKKEVTQRVKANEYLDAPDLVEQLIEEGGKVITYHLLDYWLDIGRMEDYEKAQEDVKHLNL